MRLRLLIWAAAVCLIAGGWAFGLGLPENVLVVRNGNSPTSLSIAEYYRSKRAIPAGNVVTISTPDSSLSEGNETISLPDYQTLIETPIKSYLSTNGLTNSIQYIVLTKGVPPRLTSDPRGGNSGPRSVDSVLAAMDLVNPIDVALEGQNHVYLGSVFVNRYWRATEPFTHAAYGGYLVTRLDGYTEADAKALVDNAIAPQLVPFHIFIDANPGPGMGDATLQPKSWLLPDGTLDPNFNLDYFDYNADMLRASQILATKPQFSVQLNADSTFLSGSNLAGYVSWGSNDWQYSYSNYVSTTFAPGGIAETAVSSSGRTFLQLSPDPAVTGGQSLVTDLIAHGAIGVKGYVTEPFLDAIASPSVLLDLYSSGRNLAESYYAASRFVGWKDVVIGDPLAHLVGTQAATIGNAKALPDGTLVSLSNKTVSAGTNDFADRFYIEETDRSSGIQVYLGRNVPGIAEGDVVSVRGTLGLRSGERVLLNATVISATPLLARTATQSVTVATPLTRLRVKPVRSH